MVQKLGADGSLGIEDKNEDGLIQYWRIQKPTSW
ncbi:MAG: hypothetical protein CM15mP74_35080 [Halieaceae bacterium]|nr:MAG: hypothetical protein CM15mP74_35080 [Halieaceae bacterium]